MWGMPLEVDDLPHCCQLTTDRGNLAGADAIVYHIPTLPRKPRFDQSNQLHVAWSMESESNYPRLRDPAFIDRFDLTMTYRLDSNIPVPYLSQYLSGDGIVPVLRRPVPSKTPGNLASMFISSSMNKSGRDGYVAELMKHLDVHSFGKRRTNRRLPVEDRGRPSKLHTISQYKFDLSFENSIDDDYVTEKFYDPLICGTVPVYLGAPNIDQFAPGEHCFINTADFAGPRELADYLLHLDRDDTAYNAFFKWKTQPLYPAFDALQQLSATSCFARLCTKLQELRAR